MPIRRHLSQHDRAEELPLITDEGYLDQAPRTDVEARLDPGRVEAYAVGIGAMVTRLVRAARAVGVPEAHVHAESYG